MITLDGSQGEGGGQILRSALTLSLVTGRPFQITRIRAGRPKPGLKRQHLACVEAAAKIGGASVTGAILGSTELSFAPGRLVPGNYEFKIDGAGSSLLLLQTILLPLLLADESSELLLEGGTHNPFAPPFPFVAHAFLPLLRRMGFGVEAVLDRPGFFPNGGGRCRVSIRPATGLQLLRLEPRVARADSSSVSAAAPLELSAQVCLAGLPRSVAEQQLAGLQQHLPIPSHRCQIDEGVGAVGPGNTLHLLAAMDGYAEVFSGFGAPRIRAEKVIEEALRPARAFLASGAVVGEHLADQLLLPLALARGGTFVTTEPTEHTRTNAAIIQQFLPADITLTPAGPNQWCINVSPSKVL